MGTKRESLWKKLQRGQAMMEYWPTLPACIMIMIAGGALAKMLNGAFFKTTDALYRAGLSTEVCDATSETTDGSDQALMNDHSIQSSAAVYDPETDTTTLTFTVTSGTSPSISHWVLGIPKDVADNVIDQSEKWAWTDNDPATGVSGMKFDTGYAGSPSGGSDPADTGKPDKKKKVISLAAYDFSAHAELLPTGETRTIAIVLSGQYDYQPVTVAVKAGTETYTSTITAPIGVPVPVESSGDEFLDKLNQYSEEYGCAS